MTPTRSGSVREPRRARKLVLWASAAALFSLVSVGVFAANGWFPRTDAFSGKRYGWFGRELPEHATNAWDPVIPPSPTPQLSKEYIYAGGRLLAVEDANAQAAPPADIAVWRPSSGVWWVMGQTGSAATTLAWGAAGDVPVLGDYDGDGRTDFTVFRPGSPTSQFYLWGSGGGSWVGHPWGGGTDAPVAGDFDGDGRTDYAIVRRDAGAGTCTFHIVRSSDSGTQVTAWGAHTDVPAVADYDGDGRADVAVFRPSDGTFHSIDSSTGATRVEGLGFAGTVVSSDYDGDGRADQAVYDPSNSNWHVRLSTTVSVASTAWGSAGDLPVHNDYDGDGRTDLAVFNNAATAAWTIKRSSDGSTRTESWGTTGDIPVPAWYRR